MIRRRRSTSALLLGVASLLALPLGAQTAAPGELPLSLAEAIARALATNEDILIERTAVATAEAAAAGARGAYDPLLSLGVDWSQASTPVNSTFSGAANGALAPTREATTATAGLSRLLTSGTEVGVSASSARNTSDSVFDLLSPAWNSQLGVSLRQPLLRDRAIDAPRAGIEVAAADRRTAGAAFELQVIATVTAVETTYWSLVAARREVAVREEAVALAREQLAETRLRIEGGALPETEEAQPRAELERRQGELLAARELAHRTQSALQQLILAADDDSLWAARVEPTDAVEMERRPVELAAAMAGALDSRAELAAARSAIERRRVERALADNSVKPSLDLVFAYDRFGLAGTRNPAVQGIPGLPSEVPAGLEGDFGDSFSSAFDGDYDEASLGLAMTLPLGRRAARAQAEIASQAERRAEAELARAKKGVRVEVLDAAAALDTAAARIDAARAGREAAEVQLAAERDRYAVGLSTNFLVLTRQNDLAEARLAEIGALTDYRIADLGLRRATGSLLRDRSIDVRAADGGSNR